MRLRFPSVRLLPLLLAVATLMLGIRLFDLAHMLAMVDSEVLPIPAAHAEATKPPAPPPASGAHSENKAQDGKPAANQPPPLPIPAAQPQPPVQAQPVVQAQPPVPSPQEVEVLQQLARRREALDARAEEIERNADTLRAAEARLDQKLKEMQSLQSVLQGLLKNHDEQQETQMRSLVKIYENMKPKDAARIFEELEMETLLPVAERMNERRLAPVMAEMNPAKAKMITQELAKLRQLVSGSRPPKAG